MPLTHPEISRSSTARNSFHHTPAPQTTLTSSENFESGVTPLTYQSASSTTRYIQSPGQALITPWHQRQHPQRQLLESATKTPSSTTGNPFHIRQSMAEERWNVGAIAEIRCTICKRYIRDDVVHFMMECPKFWKERSEYLTILSQLDTELVAPLMGPDDRWE